MKKRRSFYDSRFPIYGLSINEASFDFIMISKIKYNGEKYAVFLPFKDQDVEFRPYVARIALRILSKYYFDYDVSDKDAELVWDLAQRKLKEKYYDI